LADVSAIAIFQDPVGAAVAEGMVDANGHAQADLPLGGSVTVIRITDSTQLDRDISLTTIRGVQPGDEITVGETARQGRVGASDSTMTVQFTPRAAGDSYTFFTSCGGASVGQGSSTPLGFMDSCHGASFDLLSVASNSNEDPAAGYVFQTGIPYAAGGSVTVPDTWSPLGTFTATLTHVPADLATLRYSHSIVLGEAGAAFFDGALANPAAGTVQVTLPSPPVGTGTGTLADFFLYSALGGSQVVSVRRPDATASVDIDLAHDLPWIVGPATGTITGASWDQRDGAAPDARLVSWRGRWSDGTRTNVVTWVIEDGEHTTSVTLPSLPDSYAAYDPTRASGVTVETPTVSYVDVDVLDGYDAARGYGPDLVTPLASLGVLVDRPVQQRVTINPLRE
jgi:hypothetical protein